MITVIGVGPGNMDYITPAAAKALQGAQTVVGGERLLSSFVQDKKTFPIKNNLPEVVAFIKEEMERGPVAVLASGDPGMYGILSFLLSHFPKEKLEVIPGISSVQLACARLQMPWQDAVITSVHGRDPENLVDLVKACPKIVILTDYTSTPAVVAERLIKAGVEGKTAFVCQNLSYENEFVGQFTLAELIKSPGYPGSVLVITDAE